MRLRPLRKATTMPLIDEVRGTCFARFSTDLLLSRKVVISEGTIDGKDESCPVYHGSTLVSVDLSRPDTAGMAAWLGTPDGRTALERSIPLHVRLLRLARIEAERRVEPMLLRALNATMEFKVAGDALLMDIHVECLLAVLRQDERDADGESP
jgi:hypothetical protein